MAGPEIDEYKREVRTTYEKLDPATTCAGGFAEYAKVSRFIKTKIATGEETEYSPIQREVVWGKTVTKALEELDTGKKEALAKADAETKAANESIISLGGKVEAAVVP